MSKDKSAKKDKLRKYDLFSMMMEQSAVFREMVARFQGAFALPTLTITTTADTPQSPAAQPATARKASKAPAVKAPASARPAAKAASTRKSRKPAAPTTAARKASGKTVPVKKRAPTKKVRPVAVKKTTSSSTRKTAARKLPAAKK
jgi:hypothetical protein